MILKNDFEKYAITHKSPERVADFFIKKINELIDFKKEDNRKIKVLDFGCGDGRHLSYLSNFLPIDNLFGAEVSEIRCERVRNKGFNCELIKSCVTGYPSESFDLILFLEVIEHVSSHDILEVMSEIKRLLKKGGVLMLTTPNYPIKRLYDIKNGLRQRDFKKIFHDHPTHVTFYNFNRLDRLLRRYFESVSLSPTRVMLEDKITFLKKSRILSHKIFGVCIK